MTGTILVLNAGSSSLKFAVFAVRDDAPVLHGSGQVEGIGATPRFTARDSTGQVVKRQEDSSGPGSRFTHAAAVGLVIDWLDSLADLGDVIAVGHRVVHGGVAHTEPVLLDPRVVADLRQLVPLAPLHQPHNLAGIDAVSQHYPHVPQVACFDTAFHRSQPWEAETFALPERFYRQGVRRYGFHGLSYEFIARQLAAEDPGLGMSRLVVAHLGNGASLCAIQGGRSRGSSMGFTALDGVPMGTRCGQIDPGVVLHMLDALGMTTQEVAHLLYHDSGLKGLSGISQDVREIEARGGEAAQRALDYFAYRVRREIGALATALDGLDALVFTAGIGENARGVRERICAGLEFLGITIDPVRNMANEPEISRAGSQVRVLVRRTDEELMVARHTLDVVSVTPQPV